MKTERNKERFPEEFCFQLNSKKLDNLRSQTVTTKQLSNISYMSRSLPYAFTHLRRFILKNENLIVLYKNNTKYDKKIREIEERIFKIEKEKK